MIPGRALRTSNHLDSGRDDFSQEEECTRATLQTIYANFWRRRVKKIGTDPFKELIANIKIIKKCLQHKIHMYLDEFYNFRLEHFSKLCVLAEKNARKQCFLWFFYDFTIKIDYSTIFTNHIRNHRVKIRKYFEGNRRVQLFGTAPFFLYICTNCFYISILINKFFCLVLVFLRSIEYE